MFELPASAPDYYVISPIIDNVLIAKDGDGNFLLPAFNVFQHASLAGNTRI
ncbi:MAG: hypothetical protein HN356_15225 [Calditrichaeota bacterium]|nr:hypothetical protein [Calditrichota bacterium]